MDSPILNRIPNVFIHVKDMPKAVAWYSKILGLPSQPTSHEGTIYDVPMEGGSGLILDANKHLKGDFDRPLMMFATPDIQAARQFLRQQGVEVVNDIQDAGSVLFFDFKDPDGNVLMVCQYK
jgi:predicted enzyme related to lactoylglutathione lyase